MKNFLSSKMLILLLFYSFISTLLFFVSNQKIPLTNYHQVIITRLGIINSLSKQEPWTILTSLDAVSKYYSQRHQTSQQPGFMNIESTSSYTNSINKLSGTKIWWVFTTKLLLEWMMKIWKLKSSAKGSQMQTIRVDVANWAPLSWWWPGGCTFILVAPAPCTDPPTLPSSLLWALANAFSWIPLTEKYPQVNLKLR